MTVSQKKMRSFVSDFTVYLGDLTASGKLVSVQSPKPKSGTGDGSYKLCTKDGQKIFQSWRSEGGETFEKDELARYIEGEDGEMQIIDPEEIAEAKKSQLEQNSMHITVHRISEMADQMWPAGDRNSFVFVPDQAKEMNTLVERVLLRGLSSKKYGLVAHCNVRGNEAIFRLVEWRGYLVLQPQIYTNKLNPHERQDFRVPAEITAKAEALLDQLCTDFDGDSYVDGTLDRIREAEANAVGKVDGKSLATKVSAPKPQVDLMSVLDAALSDAT